MVIARKQKILLLSSLIILTAFLSSRSVHASDKNTKVELGAPQTNIAVPGLDFTAIEKLTTPGLDPITDEWSNQLVWVPFIGEYIAAVFNYAIVIAIILALIMIVIAGGEWVASAGNTETIGRAQKRIKGAIIGLLIALGSFSLLYAINPELVRFRSLKVNYIKTQDYGFSEITDGGSPDLSGSGTNPASGSAYKAGPPIPGVWDGTIIPTSVSEAQKINESNQNKFECPGPGSNMTQNDLSRIAKSFVHRVTYIYGSQGKGTQSKACPSNTICFDCFFYIQKVFQCAGLPVPPSSRAIADTSKGGEKIKSRVSETNGVKTEIFDIDYEKNKVNGSPLQSGDILGWLQSDGFKFGHVMLYIGDGEIVDATGADKELNGNIKVHKLSDLKSSKTYKFRWILRFANIK